VFELALEKKVILGCRGKLHMKNVDKGTGLTHDLPWEYRKPCVT